MDMEVDEVDISGSSKADEMFDCVICGQSSATTSDRPIGVSVLMQATKGIIIMFHPSPNYLPQSLILTWLYHNLRLAHIKGMKSLSCLHMELYPLRAEEII